MENKVVLESMMVVPPMIDALQIHQRAREFQIINVSEEYKNIAILVCFPFSLRQSSATKRIGTNAINKMIPE